MKNFINDAIENVQVKNPLIHHITNYVTVNDCANVTLAIGASPIMADDPQEAAEITSISKALVINMGTLNERTVSAMIVAGKMANKLEIPVVFDPVGAGASTFRNQTAEKLLKNIQFAVIRGNISEIRFLAGFTSTTKGVDASLKDLEKETEVQQVAQQLARSMNCVAAVTGAIDVISTGNQTISIKNGCEDMKRVTGTGCMATSLIASFAASSSNLLYAAATAIMTMGIAGEFAHKHTKDKGTGSFRTNIIDQVSKMDSKNLKEYGLFDES